MLSACPPLESERAAWRRAPEQTAAPPSSYLASLFRRAPSRPTAKVSPMSLDQTVTHVIRLSQARALPRTSPHLDFDRQQMIDHVSAAIGIAMRWLRSAE